MGLCSLVLHRTASLIPGTPWVYQGAESNHTTFLSPAVGVYSIVYTFKKQNINPLKQSFSEARKNKVYHLLESEKETKKYLRILYSHP